MCEKRGHPTLGCGREEREERSYGEGRERERFFIKNQLARNPRDIPFI